MEQSQLEMWVIDHFRNTDEPMEKYNENEHLLQEFVDGYKGAPQAYTDGSEEQLELLNSFVKIVEKDINTSEVSSEEFKTVVKAIETFGL